MDTGLYSYLRNNKSAGTLANITSLKSGLYDKATHAGDMSTQLQDLNLQDQIGKLSGVSNEVEGVGGALSGTLTGVSALMNTKKLISLAKAKLNGGKGDAAGENLAKDSGTLDNVESMATDTTNSVKEGISNLAKQATNVVSKSTNGISDAVNSVSGSITRKIGSVAKNISSVTAKQPTVTETDLAPKTFGSNSNEPGMERGMVSNEPSGRVGGDIEMTEIKEGQILRTQPSGVGGGESNVVNDAEDLANNAMKSVSETATGAVDGAMDGVANAASDLTSATIDTTVGGIEAAGGLMDAIPVVGDIVGGIMAVGGAIFGAVESAKESSDTAQETMNQSNQISKDNAVKSKINSMNFSGGNVSNTLSSLSQMPSNSGQF